MKKIFFILPSLSEGGAEKIVTILLNCLDQKTFCLSLVLFEKKGKLLDKVPSGVNIYDLKKKNRFSFFNLIFKLSKIIKKEKPDVVVSFLEYANLITLSSKKLCKSKKTYWIISERSLPSLSFRNMRFYRIRKFMHNWLDKEADLIIVNSQGTKEELIGNFHISGEKVKIIPNPVEIKKIEKLSGELPRHPWFNEKIPILVSVGRLSKPKGFPYLLEAFSLTLKEVKCRLMILGDGEMKMKLEKIINDLNIKNSVSFLGFVENPYPYVRKANIFILSSLWEGLPNALLEAMALGKPIIVTRCSKQIEKIIENGKSGILVSPGNSKALKNAIVKLLGDKELQKKIGEEAKNKVFSFSADRITKEYESVFLNESIVGK